MDHKKQNQCSTMIGRPLILPVASDGVLVDAFLNLDDHYSDSFMRTQNFLPFGLTIVQSPIAFIK